MHSVLHLKINIQPNVTYDKNGPCKNVYAVDVQTKMNYLLHPDSKVWGTKTGVNLIMNATCGLCVISVLRQGHSIAACGLSLN